MKTIITILFLASSAASAQIPANQSTGGHYNGRFWLNVGDKVDFLLGYTDCLVLLRPPVSASSRKMYEDLGIKQPSEPWTPGFPGTLSYGEVAKALTRFYDQPENLEIAIWEALQIIELTVEGKTPEEVQKATSDARAGAQCWRDWDRCLADWLKAYQKEHPVKQAKP